MAIEALHSCMICGAPVLWLWTCPDCAHAFGLTVPFRDWPEWARELKRLAQQERRAELERLEWEVEIDGYAADV